MNSNWKNVRVFISSTFQDMEAERDHLIRFVFPRLREELLKRRILLIDVDLRWGVTSDQDALEVCKEIIDECRPRFLCILGGRYGWIPPGKKQSITASEIRYSLKKHNAKQYRFFYFRVPLSTQTIPENISRIRGYREFPQPEEIAQFGLEKSELLARQRTEQLESLKKEIITAGYTPFIYPARWDNKEQRLVDLGEFGDQVYTDLLWSIDDELGTEEPADLDEFTAERSTQEAFIQERLSGYVLGSRQKLYAKLLSFAKSSGKPNIMVIHGAPGCGKTALLGKFCQEYTEVRPKDLVLFHFVGASKGSINLRRSLRRWCHELAGALGLEIEIPQDLRELRQMLADLLPDAAKRQRIVFVLDAVNQFDAADDAATLYWLPKELPARLKVVISTPEHPVLEKLRQRTDVIEQKMEPLSNADASVIVENVLQRYHKRMSPEQIQALLAKPESGNPLYLLTALEELRTLGTYEEITERIHNLPGEIGLLFRWILQERLSHDPGFRDEQGKLVGIDLVREFASLLATSRHGLSQVELGELLAPGNPQADPPMPSDRLGNVTALLRLLRPYLMHRGELLDFYHSQFKEAAEAAYLDDAVRHKVHQRLAYFFKSQADPTANSTWSGEDPHALSELPYHLTQAGMYPVLVETLTSYSFLQNKLNSFNTYALLTDFDLALESRSAPGSPLGEEENKILSLIQGSLRLAAHTLDRKPGQLAGQLWGRLSGYESIGMRNFLENIRQVKSDPWLRPITSSLVSPGGPLIRTLSAFSRVTSLALSTDEQKLVSALDDGRIEVWDWTNGKILTTLQGHKETIGGIAITPDGRQVVSGSYDKTIKIWDLETGTALQTLTSDKGVNWVGVIPGGERLASMSNDHIELWDLKNSKVVDRFEIQSPDQRPVLSLDGRLLFCPTIEIAINWFDLETGIVRRISTGVEGWLERAAMTPDGTELLWTTQDNVIRVWNLETGEERCVFHGHKDEITAIAVTPDGRLALSSSEDKTIKVWDLKTGTDLFTLRGHKKGIRDLQLTPDGRRVLSASDDKTIKVWDVASGDLIRTLQGHKHGLLGLVLTPDGRRLVSTADDKTIRVWDLENGKELACHKLPYDHLYKDSLAVTPKGDQVVFVDTDDPQRVKVWDVGTVKKPFTINQQNNLSRCLEVFPDGRRVLSATEDNDLKVWDLETGKDILSLPGHTSGISQLALLSDSRRAVSVSYDETLKVWDLETGKELRSLDGVPPESDDGPLFFSADKRRVAFFTSDCYVKVLDLENGKKSYRLDHDEPVYAMAASPDCQKLITNCGGNSLFVWDLKERKKLFTIPGDFDSSTPPIVSSSKSWIITKSGNGFLQTWNLKSGELMDSTPIRYLGNNLVATDNRIIISASDEGPMIVWDLETERLSQSRPGHHDEVTAVAVTPDGRKAVSASTDKTLKVWDLENDQELFTLTGHTERINDLVVTPDGSRVISAASDYTLKVWSLEDGALLATLSDIDNWVSNVAVTSDSCRAVSNAEKIKVWDLKTGKELLTLDDHIVHNSVERFVLTPDDRRLLSVSNDNDKVIKVWNLETGKRLKVLRGHKESIFSLAVSPDSRLALSGSSDRMLKIWDLESGKSLASLTGHSGGVNVILPTPDGLWAVSGDWDGVVLVWDIANQREIDAWRTHHESMKMLLTGDGRLLISRGEEGEIVLVDLTYRELVTDLALDECVLMAATSDGRKMIAGDASGTVHLLHLENYESVDIGIGLNDRAHTFLEQGDPARAESFYCRALAVVEQTRGSNHPDTAQILGNLGSLYKNQNKLEEAKTQYARALAIREVSQGQEHPETIATMIELALMLKTMDEYDHSETLFRQAVARREISSGPEALETGVAMYHLASVLTNQGNNAETASLLRRALDIIKKQEGSEHLDVAIIAKDLADVLREQELAAEAETFYRQALNIREKVAPEELLQISIIQNGLALVLKNLNKPVEAESFFRRALSIAEEVLGPNHPDLAVILQNLAILLEGKGDIAEASKLMRRAELMREQ